jgi:hypothetical protein
MKPYRTKPNRTVGILFVIVIALVLVSGLAPSAGAQDGPDHLAPNWETGTNLAHTRSHDVQGIILDGGNGVGVESLR